MLPILNQAKAVIDIVLPPQVELRGALLTLDLPTTPARFMQRADGQFLVDSNGKLLITPAVFMPLL